jgi:hypothetical protein
MTKRRYQFSAQCKASWEASFVAVEGARRLYQVKKAETMIRSVAPWSCHSLNSEGDAEEGSGKFKNALHRRLLAVNGNGRLLLLLAQIEKKVTPTEYPNIIEALC